MNRLLLAAYPKAYRDRYGNELLACLAEAHPGRDWPPPREVAALLRGGVQAHARDAADDPGRPWWLDGIHLAALSLAALALVPYLQDVWDWALRIDPGSRAIGFHSPGWYPWAQGPGTQSRMLPYGLLPLVALVGLLRGRPWIALPASAAMIYAGATLGSSTFFGDEGVVGTGYYGLGTPVLANNLVLSVTLFVACVVLAARAPGRLRRRSYGWLVPVAGAMFLAGGLHLASYDPWFQRGQFALEAAALVAAWWATSTTGDYRWTIPVAALALVRVHVILAGSTPLDFRHVSNASVLLVLIAVLPTLVVAAWDKRSRSRLR
ncbi:hypothetical protein [Streptomyces sp. NBC_01240]|uniref:hypothetical protein n=1 Tax=Streptomyces sp. NBC_01240 TaxID=2903793 RepID=UPI002E1670B7|nr:hypothetical protein OG466_18695 [Streptomyces sp. NBC_01240]